MYYWVKLHMVFIIAHAIIAKRIPSSVAKDDGLNDLVLYTQVHNDLEEVAFG